MRTSDLEHVSRDRRRTDKLGVVLAPRGRQVAIDDAIVIESCDRVRSIEGKRIVRLTELPDEVFGSGWENGSRRRSTTNATKERRLLF